MGSKDWLEEELEDYEDPEGVIPDPRLRKAERHQKKLRRQREEEKRAQEETP